MFKIKISGNLQDLTETSVADIYNHYGEDMHMCLDAFVPFTLKLKREVSRCRHKWLSVKDGIPQTLVETLDFSIPEFYPGIAVAVKTLVTYPVSTCAAERSFSSMKRLKTPLRSAMSDAKLSSLSVMHVHKYKEIDLNEVVSVFARRKDRRLALCL